MSLDGITDSSLIIFFSHIREAITPIRLRVCLEVYVKVFILESFYVVNFSGKRFTEKIGW